MERIYGELQNVIGKELLKHFSGKYEIIVDTYTVSVRLKGDIHQATVYNFKTKKYDIRNMERFKTVLERALIDNDEAPESKDIISDTNRVIDEIKGTMKEPDELNLHTSIESKQWGTDMLLVPQALYVSKTDLGSSVHLMDMGYRLVVENDGSNEYKVGVEDVTSGKILRYLLPTDTDEELKTKMRNAVIEGNKVYIG